MKCADDEQAATTTSEPWKRAKGLDGPTRGRNSMDPTTPVIPEEYATAGCEGWRQGDVDDDLNKRNGNGRSTTYGFGMKEEGRMGEQGKEKSGRDGGESPAALFARLLLW
ncbi:hypothetical protein An07g01630 [Aspergillus niger]|uniref:Uncharacterized protein n=2 Tax=Aspergillus niger TaxID=5061 RepID=A2QMC7_ASPNC|nr:hypothetical protein An07g01630 [Aspergillus niger]CAK96608.1 hypothetical protein An07g01630 [Aspergillus niger]